MTMLGSPPRAPTGAALVRFVDALESLLDNAVTASAWSLSRPELQNLLPRLTRAEARLTEIGLRTLREADRQSVGDEVGAANTPAWWAYVTGQRIPAARAAARLAEQLDEDHEITRAALARGSVHLDQARVIVAAVEALPVDLVGMEAVADAETHLVGLADLDGDSRLDPRALRIAGRKILEVVAPDLAEQHEQKVLQAEERDAAAAAYLLLRPDGHGSVYGRFKIPVLHGEMLAKHLAAVAAPGHQRTVDGAERPDGTVSRPLRLGQAFCEYLETRDTATDGSPKAGGMAATVVVTMTLEQLLGDLAGSERGSCSTAARRSQPAPPAAWPARPASSRPCSGPRHNLSTSAGGRGSTPSRNALPPCSATAGVRRSAVTGLPACATCTTGTPGARAVPPRSRMPSCSARVTTRSPTTIATR